MAISSREELIEFTLRSLGSPVIQINVTEEQVNDRLEDTLAIWWEYNYEGSERDYLRYQVTEQDLYNEYIPIDGSAIYGITRVIPITRTMMGNAALPFDPYFQMLTSTMNMQSGGWSSIDLVSYYNFRTFGETLEHLLRPKMNVRYNRFKNRLYLDINWGHRNWNSGGLLTEDSQLVLVEGDTYGDDVKEQILFDLEKPEGQSRGSYHGMGSAPDLVAGDFIILECMKVLDPSEFPDIYNSTWIKRYFKAKVMLQWGQNLAKYSNLNLPGGVVLDGNSMKQEAEQEIEKLFEALYTDYSAPISMLIG